MIPGGVGVIPALVAGPVERVFASKSGARGQFRACSAGPIFLVLFGIAGALAGCSDPLGPERDTFEENLGKWLAASIDSYTYRYQLNCFCGGPGIRPVDIQVENGIVVAVSFPGGGPPEAFPLDDYPTVAELFANVSEALDREPFSVRVMYDGALGYPRDFFADFEENVADEELGFLASNLTPAGG